MSILATSFTFLSRQVLLNYLEFSDLLLDSLLELGVALYNTGYNQVSEACRIQLVTVCRNRGVFLTNRCTMIWASASKEANLPNQSDDYLDVFQTHCRSIFLERPRCSRSCCSCNFSSVGCVSYFNITGHFAALALSTNWLYFISIRKFFLKLGFV